MRVKSVSCKANISYFVFTTMFCMSASIALHAAPSPILEKPIEQVIAEQQMAQTHVIIPDSPYAARQERLKANRDAPSALNRRPNEIAPVLNTPYQPPVSSSVPVYANDYTPYSEPMMLPEVIVDGSQIMDNSEPIAVAPQPQIPQVNQRFTQPTVSKTVAQPKQSSLLPPPELVNPLPRPQSVETTADAPVKPLTLVDPTPQFLAPIDAQVPDEPSMAITRDMVVPPDLQQAEKESFEVNPVSAPITQERFDEDLTMPAPVLMQQQPISDAREKLDMQGNHSIQQLLSQPYANDVVTAQNEKNALAIVMPELDLAPLPRVNSKDSMSDVAVMPVQTKSELAIIAADLQRNQGAPVTPVAVTGVASPLAIENQVVIQPITGAKPFSIDRSKVTLEPPVDTVALLLNQSLVLQEEARLSQESKTMLKNFPSGLDAPKRSANKIENVSISRATVPNLAITQPDIKKHEALGISIEVKTPNLNVNDYLTLAYEAMENGQTDLAMDYYDQILMSNPANQDALLGSATLYHRNGDKQKARALYRQILSQSPRNTDVLNNYLVLVSEESPVEALSELQDLENKNPHYAVLPAQIAALQARQGNMPAAIQKMMRAISLNPDDLLYKYNLAVMLDHAGQRDEAINAYSTVKRAIEKGQKLPLDDTNIQERLTFLLSNRKS